MTYRVAARNLNGIRRPLRQLAQGASWPEIMSIRAIYKLEQQFNHLSIPLRRPQGSLLISADEVEYLLERLTCGLLSFPEESRESLGDVGAELGVVELRLEGGSSLLLELARVGGGNNCRYYKR